MSEGTVLEQPSEKHGPVMPVGPRMGACIIRNDLEVRLIQRAWRDDAFKQRLLTDPKAAITEELGVDVLEGVEVEVLEESPKRAFLLLPMHPGKVGVEVPDEELKKVAVSMWT
jgi:hypothetical protein